jgi:arginyl-tRNA synthetase
MNFEQALKEKIVEGLLKLYSINIVANEITFQETRKEFEGDFTLVVFPFIKQSKKSPEITANEIGEYVKTNSDLLCSFNVVKGFLNLSLADIYWMEYFNEIGLKGNYDIIIPPKEDGIKTVMVEYSSPNTNKPLHLGHIRNILLGHSVAMILKKVGKTVIRANLINDRGIHICKSMLAWQRWGHDETPKSVKIKGDHLVGKYYVLFDQKYKKEIEELIKNGSTVEDAKKNAPLIIEAQEMLRKWEDGDIQVIALWTKMNSWVYEGFDDTYKKMGVDFDKLYYESETYLLGKEIIEEGLVQGVFFKKPDGSVWVDLTDEGLDEKLLLRSDGTSVYISQDL